ncbi:MAG: T9SS type A sorting domain-containing protein [Calditrichaeota bacterium]|nr:T9SS type A sorting domain-containing protein [Calditrichota bacterium]MCB9391794.1 T9SS type A sorting domain-containing protein [Calditrichota bacterium]
MRYIILSLLLIASYCSAQEMIWARNGLENGARYGVRVFSLGDVNSDGFMDFAVESQYGNNPSLYWGYLEMFHGGQPPSPTPFRTLLPDTSAGLRYGTFYVLGDINGDGLTDWTEDQLLRSDVHTEVFRFFYDGFNDTEYDLEWRIRDQSLYPMGDFNGDGFDDIYRYYESPLDYGEVYFGGTSFDTIPDWTMHSPEGHRYQAWLRFFGDLNGDGISDAFAPPSEESEQLPVFFGGVSADTVPSLFLSGFRDYPFRAVNDLNGDGRDEIVGNGLPRQNINVYFGGETMSSTPDRVLQFQGCNGASEMISAGDVNDDGYNDMIVIGWTCTRTGKLALYLGSPWVNTNPVFEFLGAQDPYDLVAVFSAAGYGDVNGDGVEDFGVGAWSDDADGTRGRAIVIAGSRNWIVPAEEHRVPYPRDFQVSAFPNPFNSQTTLRMDLPLGTRSVKVDVFNTLGQQVEQVESPVLASRVDVRLSADDWASGIYLVKVEAASHSRTQKLVLLK